MPIFKAHGRESKTIAGDSESFAKVTSGTDGNCRRGNHIAPGWTGGSIRKWQHDDRIDAAIRSALSQPGLRSAQIDSLAGELGWTEKAIRRRARELGVCTRLQAAWDPAELVILKSMNQARVKEIAARLAADGFHRSEAAILHQRRSFGWKPADAQSRRKYRSNDSIDEAIRASFSQKYERRGAIRAAQKATGWSASAVVRRARELGLSQARMTATWTAGEEQVLEEIPFQSAALIQARLAKATGRKRSLTAITTKLRRMALTRNMDGLNLGQLADALGVGDRMIHRWLERGAIRGIVRFPELQEVGRHVWFFPSEEIRRFVLANIQAIDLCRVEKHWFVDLIANCPKTKKLT